MAEEEREEGLLFNQGKVFFVKGKHQKALQCFSRLIAKDKLNADALALSSLAKSRLGRGTEAVQDASAAVKANDSSGLAHCAMAVVRWKQGNAKEAGEEFGRAATLSPKEAVIFFERAEYRKSQGRKAEAAEDYSKAARLDPIFSPAAREADSLKKSIPPPPTLGALEGDTEITEISSEFFDARVPKGWRFEIHDNLYVFKREDYPDATFTLSAISAPEAEVAEMSSSFYQFVEEEVKKKPFKVGDRRMAAGKAKEAHVASEYGKQKLHIIYVGYPGKTAFFLLNFTAPDSAPVECLKDFEWFLSNLLPAGMKKVRAAGEEKKQGLQSILLTAALALVGLALFLGAGFAVLSAPGVASGNAPLTTGLALAALGFLLIANAVFKLNPQLIYMLNFIFYVLVIALFAVSYLSFSSASMVLFGSAGQGGIELTGIIAQALAILIMLKCVVLVVAGVALLLYSKAKAIELDEAYVKAYSAVKEKAGVR